MPGANQQPKSPLPVRDEFAALLESQWTRQVACQNECRPPASCSCQREIVHVHALEAWWKKQASESPKYTKLERFVHEMPILPHRNLPLRPTRISRVGQSCLRVLSLLLKQERDHLIDRFYEANMYDDYLARSKSDQNLREQLAGVVRHEEVDTIIEDFHEEKWKYCPLSLSLDMDSNLQGTKVIPPFCLKTKLPDKGGTASIYWVAVQKDLISDNALALVLQDSLYTDEEFGECYQMVLKSYCGNKKRDFELEKEAFSGLQSNDPVPILKYLGSYIHDYGEGQRLGRTYNLLLEYGENDLYQAWADETNVPPVQAQEILQSWMSLFKVAEAIRHVHHLEILRGKGRPWKFHGWHADIKPDNILSVRGRLKLADFGFSSFAPVVEGHEGSEPIELIRGFTDSYGAPEVSRMKQADGTLSGVSQAIDAWSFGCVLSVAATWIVLGFQGLRQYERLRELSPANNKDGIRLDRFHDGYHVLPEVGKWHDYLRGHLRPSDTTTELVLTLIENKLLRAEPGARHTLEELCEKLQELSDWAEHKIKTLRKHSRDTDPLVMRALSSIEHEAQVQRTSEPKINLLQQPLLQVNPRERASMQINKEEMIRNKPLGQTAHRRQILEEKLEDCYGKLADEEPQLSNDKHNGDFAESPTDSTPAKEQLFIGRKTKPRNPQRRMSDREHSERGPRTPISPRLYTTFNLPATPPPSSNRIKSISGPDAGLSGDDPFITDSHISSLEVDSPARVDSRRSNLQIPKADPPSTKYPTKPAQSHDEWASSSPSIDKEVAPKQANLSPKNLGATGEVVHFEKSKRHIPSPSVTGQEVHKEVSLTDGYSEKRQTYQATGSVKSSTGSTGSPFGKEPEDELIDGSSTAPGHPQRVERPGPLITVSHPGGDQSSYDQTQTSFQDAQSDYNSTSLHLSNRSLLPLPLYALDLPFDICLRRKEMDQLVTKGFAKGLAKVKGNFGIETRPRDASLADTFSDPRELVFIIDNGWSMSRHWPIVTFVAQTLALKAAGLDKSGFDLKFTVDGHTHNEERLKGDSGRRKLKKALREAWPEYKPNKYATTDMTHVFKNIFEEWGRAGSPATTLLVLTDAIWSKTILDTLNKTILDIARLDQRRAGYRHFSIQFIRFGDEGAMKARLQWLDDCLCADHNLRDIIDHCAWRGNVDKIFKGSIEGYADEQDSEEEPLSYDYDKLVDLFDAFNRGKEGALSPTGTLVRTPSRASNRFSFTSHA